MVAQARRRRLVRVLVAMTGLAACGPSESAATRCPEPAVAAAPTVAPTASPEPAAKPTPVAPQASAPGPNMKAVDVLGLYDFGPAAGGSAVLLYHPETGRVVPIWIGEREAITIGMRLAGEKFPRPLTHDLLDAVLAELGGQIVRVEIDALQDSTFLAHLFVRDTAGEIHRIDARPSDCIALAIGARAAVYMADGVIDQAGEPADLGLDPADLPPRPRPTA